MGGEGRDGDWECGSCRNRNYAFRSICNRCKQPRLLVDTKTPADSKWLPRIGDWICNGCSNNNYASREKCKKCGQPKDEAAMPAIGMSGASFPTYANYFARVQGLLGLRMNYGMMGSALQQSLPPFPNWPYVGANKYELQSGPNWTLSGNTSKFSYGHDANQLLEVPKGWRSGDWICNCGFHNYSSRTECKKCNTPLPSGASSSVARSTTSDFFPTLGTKRLASEEFVSDWDNKRLNARDFNSHFLENSQTRPYQSFEQLIGSSSNEITGTYSRFSGGGSSTTSNIQMHAHSPQQKLMPTLLGKGAKQWRDGDWMCTNCNNHNFASRSCCNRCKTQREASSQPVNVA